MIGKDDIRFDYGIYKRHEGKTYCRRMVAFYHEDLLQLSNKATEVLNDLWLHDFLGEPDKKKRRTLHTHICNVRRELERLRAPFVIRTVARKGYLLQPKLNDE